MHWLYQMLQMLFKKERIKFWYEKSVLWLVAQLVGASFHAPEGCRSDSRSGHILRLQVGFPVGVHTRGNRLMFLSPHPLPLALKSINIISGED